SLWPLPLSCPLLFPLRCLSPYTTLFRSQPRVVAADPEIGLEPGQELERLLRLLRFVPLVVGPDDLVDYQRHETKQPEKTLEFLRSEEHTSELQSHLNIVCRLLLEKKKKH